MAGWQFEHSAESEASPEAVWKAYEDVDMWSRWSEGVEKSSLEGPFEEGKKGAIKSPSLPGQPFELTAVDEGRSYTSKTTMPGGWIELDHEIEPAGEGTRITHRARIGGPLAFVWSRATGWMVKRDVPETVQQLAEYAAERERSEAEAAEREKERDERMKKASADFKEEAEKTATEGGSGGASLPD